MGGTRGVSLADQTPRGRCGGHTDREDSGEPSSADSQFVAYTHCTLLCIGKYIRDLYA